MKVWLKYQYGFLNIDDEFIYVTKTGNWSETNDLGEKNAGGFKTADVLRKLKVILFVVLIASLVLCSVLYMFAGKNSSLTLIIGIPVLAYFAYQYMIPEYGAAFKIPRSKIESVARRGDSVVVHFEDARGEQVEHLFSGIEPAWIAFMEGIKDGGLPNEEGEGVRMSRD